MNRMIREVGAGAAVVVGLSAGLQLASGLVANPTSRALAGAVLVGFVARRVGLVAGEARSAVRRLVIGATFGLCAALVSLALALAMGARLRLGGLGVSLPLGLAEAAAGAYRDELYLRGVPLLFAARAGIGRPLAIGFSTLSGVAAVALLPGARPAGVALAGASGMAFAALWWQARAALVPVAAHAAWKIAGDVVFAGDPLDLSRLLPTGCGASGAVAWGTTAAFLAATAIAFEHAKWIAR